MFNVRITAAKLAELRMLMDWQVREMGFDPDSVTAACNEQDDQRETMAEILNKDAVEKAKQKSIANPYSPDPETILSDSEESEPGDPAGYCQWGPEYR